MSRTGQIGMRVGWEGSALVDVETLAAEKDGIDGPNSRAQHGDGDASGREQDRATRMI